MPSSTSVCARDSSARRCEIALNARDRGALKLKPPRDRARVSIAGRQLIRGFATSPSSATRKPATALGAPSRFRLSSPNHSVPLRHQSALVFSALNRFPSVVFIGVPQHRTAPTIDEEHRLSHPTGRTVVGIDPRRAVPLPRARCVTSPRPLRPATCNFGNRK